MRILIEKHDGLWWLVHGAELPFRLWSVLRDMRSNVSEVLERYFGDNEAIKFALAANLPYYSDDPDQMQQVVIGIAFLDQHWPQATTSRAWPIRLLDDDHPGMDGTPSRFQALRGTACRDAKRPFTRIRCC